MSDQADRCRLLPVLRLASQGRIRRVPTYPDQARPLSIRACKPVVTGSCPAAPLGTEPQPPPAGVAEDPIRVAVLAELLGPICAPSLRQPRNVTLPPPNRPQAGCRRLAAQLDNLSLSRPAASPRPKTHPLRVAGRAKFPLESGMPQTSVPGRRRPPLLSPPHVREILETAYATRATPSAVPGGLKSRPVRSGERRLIHRLQPVPRSSPERLRRV